MYEYLFGKLHHNKLLKVKPAPSKQFFLNSVLSFHKHTVDLQSIDYLSTLGFSMTYAVNLQDSAALSSSVLDWSEVQSHPTIGKDWQRKQKIVLWVWKMRPVHPTIFRWERLMNMLSLFGYSIHWLWHRNLPLSQPVQWWTVSIKKFSGF